MAEDAEVGVSEAALGPRPCELPRSSPQGPRKGEKSGSQAGQANAGG